MNLCSYFIAVWYVTLKNAADVLNIQSCTWLLLESHGVTQHKWQRLSLTTIIHWICAKLPTNRNLCGTIVLYYKLKQVLKSCWICTCTVRLVPADPDMALLVTWPVKMELMELKKLDFPAPTGPIIRIRTRLTDGIRGLWFLINPMSSVLRLQHRSVLSHQISRGN